MLCHQRKFSRATILGATANSDKIAKSIPDTIKIIAVRAFESRAGDWFERVCSSRKSPQSVDTQVWAVNSRAAMPPAIAGVGRCTNSKGTTQKPRLVRLAHHSAATQTGMLAINLDVVDRHHFIMPDAAGGLDLSRVALFLAD